MHLAILMTNTDESPFARMHPGDGEKFTDLVKLARPSWSTEVFSVKDDRFPDDAFRFDGAILTGSPASVHDAQGWIARLLDLIRQLEGRRLPMFGACFGHQAIALALGGAVSRNPGGLVHGLTRNRTLTRRGWTRDLPDVVRLYASHEEQVTRLPDGAEALSAGERGEVAGFAIGRHVYTTQQHPEMTAAFFGALTDEYAAAMGPELERRARASLREPADMGPFAESVARFFEQAAEDPSR